ncbi:MAG: AraC family transcriptional regulator [Gemmatimonadota bacterium]
MTSTERAAPYMGHFVPWDGGCLLIGRGAALVPVHAHYAIQIAFGATRGIRFRTGDREPWSAYGGAIIPSRQPHSMDATQVQPNAVLFVEPETLAGRALAERHLAGGIAHVPDAVLDDLTPPLFAAWVEASQGRRTERDVADAARRIVEALTGGVSSSVTTDERLLRAIAYIQAHLDRAISLEEVAGEACLSPSRFRHLFVEQMGMGLRPYVLWRRFLRVWALLMAGETLSTAAHATGFADAAHLSRTSRTMFGFPPSAMLMVGPLPRGASGVDAHVRA